MHSITNVPRPCRKPPPSVFGRWGARVLVLVGDGGGVLVDDVDHLEPGGPAGFDCAFPLEVSEVGRDADDHVFDEVGFGLLPGQLLEILRDFSWPK